MTIFYIDPVNGNDGLDGLSWGNAWSSITNGATAGKIAPGDTIRIAKSPAPTLVDDATWTNESITVELDAPVTQEIYTQGAWTAAANVTASASTTRRIGDTAAQMAVASGHTTGIAAYYETALLDLSGFKQISFWIRTNSALAKAAYSLRLCSDTVGAVSVATIEIPAVPTTNRWQVVTVDTGSALPAVVNSIALYVDTDVAAKTVIIDNVMACKDSTAADSLTLSSLISKNSAETGGAEAWYAIRSILGTTVVIDYDTNSSVDTGQGYSGASESAPLYKRETFKTTPTSGNAATINDTGFPETGGQIEFLGGFEVGTTDQNGETFFDGQNSSGVGLQITTRQFVTIDRMSFCRYSNGIRVQNTANHLTFGEITCCTCNSTNGILFDSPTAYCSIERAQLNNNGAVGLLLNDGIYNQFDEIITKSNGTYGVSLSGASTENRFGILTSAINATADILNESGKNYFDAAELGSAASYSGLAARPVHSAKLIFKDGPSGNPDETQILSLGVNAVSSIVRQTAINHDSVDAWRVNIDDLSRSTLFPTSFDVARIAVAANKLVTVKIWMYFSSGNVGGRIVCAGGQIAGVPNDVSAAGSGTPTTWEEVTITFTPSAAGVVVIRCDAFYATGVGYVVFDDMTITQAT